MVTVYFAKIRNSRYPLSGTHQARIRKSRILTTCILEISKSVKVDLDFPLQGVFVGWNHFNLGGEANLHVFAHLLRVCQSNCSQFGQRRLSESLLTRLDVPNCTFPRCVDRILSRQYKHSCTLLAREAKQIKPSFPSYSTFSKVRMKFQSNLSKFNSW